MKEAREDAESMLRMANEQMKCYYDKNVKDAEGMKTDCGMCNQSLDVRSTTLLVRQYVRSRYT
jgi:hypothetical protein